MYRPEADWEAPKPYLHPVRTLSGGLVTDYRPNDHRWHKGLASCTASAPVRARTCGAATPTCTARVTSRCRERRRLDGPRGLRGGVGAEGDRAVIAERLTWHPHDGSLWAEEERRIEVRDVDPDAGSWTLHAGPPR